MVRQERQHPDLSKLVWRECIDPFSKDFDEFFRYWELIEAEADEFFCRQYAVIHKVRDRSYQLKVYTRRDVDRDGNELLTATVKHYPTLKAAKAVGIVLARFNGDGP